MSRGLGKLNVRPCDDMVVLVVVVVVLGVCQCQVILLNVLLAALTIQIRSGNSHFS